MKIEEIGEEIPDLAVYHNCESLPRTDLDRRPGGVRFAAFSFQTSTTHEFRVTARYETSSLTASQLSRKLFTQMGFECSKL